MKFLSMIHRAVFARPIFQKFNSALFYLSLHGLGVLNYHNDEISGERYLLRTWLPKMAAWTRLLVFLGAGLCWMEAAALVQSNTLVVEAPGSWQLMGHYALASVGSVLILIAFLGIEAGVLPRWGVYLGRISFGLYVYHGFAIYIAKRFLFAPVASYASPLILAKGLTTLGLDVVMAAISYRFFETPFLKMKQRHAVIPTEPVSGG